MRIIIDTQDIKSIKVFLSKDNFVVSKKESENEYGSQKLLGLIFDLLKENNLEYSQISGIEVLTGPGSFTGLRVGASIGNALAYGLGVNINSKHIETDLIYLT